LSNARADERFCHVNQPNNAAKYTFALLADRGLWQDRASWEAALPVWRR
jgi:hypothetical protein